MTWPDTHNTLLLATHEVHRFGLEVRCWLACTYMLFKSLKSEQLSLSATGGRAALLVPWCKGYYNADDHACAARSVQRVSCGHSCVADKAAAPPTEQSVSRHCAGPVHVLLLPQRPVTIDHMVLGVLCITPLGRVSSRCQRASHKQRRRHGRTGAC